MISAFKHIRLSGYNLLPQSVDGATRLTLNNSGVAYYTELTGVSGYLQGLINTANADVSSINGLQNAVNVSGRDGIQIFVEGQNIVVSGNNTAVQSLITNLTTDLASTGSTLNSRINSLSGTLTGNYATITNLATTGSTLDNKINSLSGYSNSTFATIQNLGTTGSNLQGQINSLSGSFVTFTGNLATTFTTDAELTAASGVLASSIALTGSTLNTRINSLSGTLTSDYVQKATQQQFIVNLPINVESTGITFPVAFASTPNSVQVTFEPSTDVAYMVAVKNRTTVGFTAEFSDVLFETGNKLNVFASV